jgi:hypothetical protein
MEGDVQQASGSTAHALGETRSTPERSAKPTVDRMAELENPLGVSRVRSVETPPEDRRRSQEPRCVAEARLLPREYAELETGAQENATQHPDACSARRLPPHDMNSPSLPGER